MTIRYTVFVNNTAYCWFDSLEDANRYVLKLLMNASNDGKEIEIRQSKLEC